MFLKHTEILFNYLVHTLLVVFLLLRVVLSCMSVDVNMGDLFFFT